MFVDHDFKKEKKLSKQQQQQILCNSKQVIFIISDNDSWLFAYIYSLMIKKNQLREIIMRKSCRLSLF